MSWRRGNRPKTKQWRKVRLVALDRDGWACVKCHKRARLEVHHIKSLDLAPDKMYDLSNIQSLCRSCHLSEHGGRGPSSEVLKWRRYLTTMPSTHVL